MASRLVGLLAVLLVLGLLPPFGVGQSAPQPVLVFPVAPVRFEEAVVVASGAGLGPQVLVNGDFSASTLSPWVAATTEVQTGGSITLSSGQALFKGDRVAKTGTIFLRQAFTKDPVGGPFHIQYKAQDVGTDPMAVALIVRERHANGTIADTQITHPLTRVLATYDHTWIPKTTTASAEFFLRVRADGGKSQAAAFDDVTIRAGPALTWEAPTGTVLASGGYQAKVRFDSLGSHAVKATASDRTTKLWDATVQVTVTNAQPVAQLATHPLQPRVLEPFQIDASASTDRDAGIQLKDTSFQDYRRAWTLTNSEPGGTLTHASGKDADGRGFLVLGIDRAAKNGSVHASQAIPLLTRDPVFFSVKVRDTGDLVRHEVILRERNATGATKDVRVQAPTTQGSEAVITTLFTPSLNQSNQLQVFLRYLVAAGKSAQVTYVQPTLQAGLNYSFSLDGRPLAAGSSALQALTLYDANPHNLTVVVTDKDGAASTTSRIVQAIDGGYDLRVATPALLPQDPALAFDASPTTRAGASPIVANGDFRAGMTAWALRSNEIGGTAQWAVGQEDGRPYARVTADANKTGTVFLTQNTGAACLLLNCSLSLQTRVVQGDPDFLVLLRSRVEAPGQEGRNVDQVLNPAVGADWTTVEAEWKRPEHATRLEVFLRFRVAANESATVDFRQVSLAPPADYEWSFLQEAQLQVLGGARVAPTLRVGPVDVHLAVTDVYGLTGNRTFAFHVLPVSFFPTQGGLGLRHTLGQGGGNVSWLDGQGQTVNLALGQRLDGANVSGIPAFERDGQQFLFLNASTLLTLDNGTVQSSLEGPSLLARMGAPVGTPVAEVRHSGGRTLLVSKVPVQDDAITSGVARYWLDGKILAEVPLQLDGGNLTASLEFPVALQGRTVDADYILTDGWGRTSKVEDNDVRVDGNPYLQGGLLAVGLVLFIVGAGVLARLRAKRGT